MDLFVFFEEYFEECFELNNAFLIFQKKFIPIRCQLANLARILGQDLPYSFFEFISLKIIDDFQVALFRRENFIKKILDEEELDSQEYLERILFIRLNLGRFIYYVFLFTFF